MSLSILIVDDEKNARENIAKFLKKKEYEELEAADLKSASKVLATDSDDLMPLNVQLPERLGTNFV